MSRGKISIVQNVLVVCCLFSVPLGSSAIEVPSDIGFKENDRIVNPIDPEEERPIEPNQPPTAGPLSLNYASDIQFGKQKLANKKREFYALPDTITQIDSGAKSTSINFVQLTDNRGTNSGWTLSVKQNAPLQNKKGTMIKGALLIIDSIKIKGAYGAKAVPTERYENIVLDSEGKQEVTVVKALPNTGAGTWTVFLGDQDKKQSSMRLTVPKDEPKEPGIYTTTLSWILQDVL